MFYEQCHTHTGLPAGKLKMGRSESAAAPDKDVLQSLQQTTDNGCAAALPESSLKLSTIYSYAIGCRRKFCRVSRKMSAKILRSKGPACQLSGKTALQLPCLTGNKGRSLLQSPWLIYSKNHRSQPLTVMPGHHQCRSPEPRFKTAALRTHVTADRCPQPCQRLWGTPRSPPS